MKKLKVMTIAGTRPELIRLSEIIKKADLYFEHIFVHTGQNYDARLNDIFYDDLKLRKPDYYLNVVGDNLGETMGNIIAKSYELMQKVKPDALLILGDTNSALTAISAKRLKVPIFHMEAGNRCFDENLPEETNRRIVDHISDVNLPYTEHARRYLISEGIRKEHIYVTGSPMKEVILAHQKEIDESNVLTTLGLTEKNYIVLSAHREENIDNEKHFESLMNAVNKMAEKYQMEAENGKKLIGTSHVLSKDMPLKDAVWHTIMPQGDILPNVENLVNPAMLLESETFHRLLNEASEEYRYIFIDAPPLDLVSDGEKIGSLCDGAILVVASGKVSRGMVQNSIHQLERAGCPLLGIVLNRVEDQRKKNYYQKYGYYASEKGKKK